MELSAAWITAGVMALGLGIALTFVTLDLRAMRSHRRALLAAVGAASDVDGWIHVTHGPRPWRLRVQQRKGQREQVELVVPARVPQTLAVHGRDLMDWTATAVGLIQPAKTGDEAFDRVLVALGGDAAVATLLAKRSTRTELLALHEADLVSFVWSAEDQAVVARWDSDHDAANDAAMAARVVALATAVTASAAAMSSDKAPGDLHVGQEGRAMIGGVLLALAMFGFGGFAAIALDASYPPVDRTRLLIGAGVVAAAATVLWGWVTWRARGRRLTDHRAWLPMLLVAAIANWIVAYAAAVGINGAAPQGESVVVKGRVLEKLSQARDGSADYTLHTTAGSFAVSHSVHRDASVGDRIRITTHPGRLGVPWRDPDKDVVVKPAR
jgi:hypothetical protein